MGLYIQDMEELKTITASELIFLGLDEFAYIKNIKYQNRDICKVYAANGAEIATVKNELEGKALLLKNDLRLVTLH